MWKTDDMKCKTLQLNKLLDASIMKPFNIQIPGILNIIVDEYLEYMCFNDHTSFRVDKEIMKRGLGYLLECVTRIDYGVSGACKGGYLYLIKQLIRRGSKTNDVNWDLSLLSTRCSGHIPIVEVVLSKDLGYGRYSMLDCWWSPSPAIEFIFNYREKNITNCAGCGEFLRKCTNCDDTFYEVLRAACFRGHIPAIKLMIHYGADNWNSGFDAACYGKQIEAAKLMLQHGVDDWREAFQAAWSSRCFTIIELILNHFSDEIGEIDSNSIRESIEMLQNKK